MATLAQRAPIACSALCTLFILAGQLASAAESEECRALGFTGLQLCSDCDTLASYVKDEELVADCRRCCVRGKAAVARKYTSATLEAMMSRLEAFPHIEGFVKNQAQKYHPALKLVDRWNTMPRLVMSAPGAAKHIVRIEGWKTEHVVEYLEDMLERRADAEESDAAAERLVDAAAGAGASRRERLESE